MTGVNELEGRGYYGKYGSYYGGYGHRRHYGGYYRPYYNRYGYNSYGYGLRYRDGEEPVEESEKLIEAPVSEN